MFSMFGIEEVHFHELHLLERLSLRMRAARDVKKGRFQKKTLKRMEAGKEVSLSFVSSPYSKYEADRYADKREAYLGRKLHLYRIMDKNLVLKFSVDRFSNMMTRYDEIIGRLETQINVEIMRVDDKLDSLLREKERYDKLQQLHMSQLCINKAEKLRSDYYSQNVEKYLALKKMLHTKLGRYKAAQKDLAEVRRKTLTRLAYYYFRACNRDESLQHYDMTEEQLSLMNDLQVMEAYQAEMEATTKKIEKIDEEISELSSWHK